MDKEQFQFRKLNDILCTSFNNVKYDVRDINTKIENLKTNFANFSTDSVRTAFEKQTQLIIAQQESINQLNERIAELERKPAVRTERIIERPHSTVFGTKESALAEVKKFIKETRPEKASSVYDVAEGEVKITKTNFKSEGKDLNGEWVELTGYGLDLTGFKLRDKKKHEFKFPDGFTIYGPVKIFTGKGKNTNTKLYWNSKKHIWNDKGDVVTLVDKKNRIVSQILSEPTYSFKKLK